MPCDILSLKWLASHGPTRILGREPDCVSVHAESAIGLCLSTKPRCVHHFASNRAVGHSCSREAKMLVGAPRRVGRRAITHVAAAAPTWVLATRRRGWARSSMAERHPEGRVLRLRRLGRSKLVGTGQHPFSGITPQTGIYRGTGGPGSIPGERPFLFPHAYNFNCRGCARIGVHVADFIIG